VLTILRGGFFLFLNLTEARAWNIQRTGEVGRGIYTELYTLLLIRDIVLLVRFLFMWGGAMDNRRFHFMDRRQDRGMPKVPFKDSDGATIRENRRKISNRRLDDVNVEWFGIRSM
jgi:hypothetical protein